MKSAFMPCWVGGGGLRDLIDSPRNHAESLRPIYKVRLCRMGQAYDRPTTRIVSCKTNLQLAYDCRARNR